MNPQTAKHSANLKIQTQNALKAINEYEKVKKMRLITTLYTLPTQSNLKSMKQFEPKQKIKLQLLPNSLAYYKMYINAYVDNKIIIRHFRGGPIQLYVFYNKLASDLEKAVHHFVVKDEIILKVEQKYFRNADSIILVFKNDRMLSMFTFRMENIDAKRKRLQLKTDRSIQSIDKLQFQQNFSSGQRLGRNKSERIKLKRVLSIDSKTFLKQKPQQKIKRIKELKEVQLQKKEAAKRRKQNLEVYKEKLKEAEKISAMGKKLFSTYQNLVTEEEAKKKQIIKNNTALIYLMKFCLTSTLFFNEKQQQQRRAMMVKHYEKRFIRKIRYAYRQTQIMVSNRQHRELLVFNGLSSSIGYLLNKTDKRKAINMVFDIFSSLFPAFLVNNAMGYSAEYKRVVRGVQRRWKAKFQARTTMLLMYMEDQLAPIMKSFPHLKVVEKQYRENNRAWNICLQYQRETANKMADLISAYNFKCQQIAEYIQINKQIEAFNKTVMKRDQKQLLDIPKKPAFPQFRFFRDISFLKGMIRGELQLQFRRYKKKYPHFFKQNEAASPQKSPKHHSKKKRK